MRFYLRSAKYYPQFVAALSGYRQAESEGPYMAIMRSFVKAESREEFLKRCANYNGLRTKVNKVIAHVFPSIVPTQHTKFGVIELQDCYAALSKSAIDKFAKMIPERYLIESALANCIDYVPEPLMECIHTCRPIPDEAIRSVESDGKLRAEIRQRVLETFASGGAVRLNFSVVGRVIPWEELAVATVLAMRDIDFVPPSHWYFLLSDLPPHCSFGWAIVKLFPELRLDFSAISQICCCNNFPSILRRLDLAGFYQAAFFIDRRNYMDSQGSDSSETVGLAGAEDVIEKAAYYYGLSCACRHRDIIVMEALERGLIETAARAAFHYADILSAKAIAALRDCKATRPVADMVEKLQSWQPRRGNNVPAVKFQSHLSSSRSKETVDEASS